MRRTLILTTILLFVLLLAAACTQEQTAVPTRATLAEVDAPTSQPSAEETMPETVEAVIPDSAEETVPEPAAAGERPLLPDLATDPIESGLGAGLGGGAVASEGAPPAEGLTLAPDAANLFEGTTINLNTTLPVDAVEAQAWQQPAVPLDVNRAIAIAGRWGFNGPLYRFATPDESVLDEPVGLEAAPLPADLPEFHVFDGTRSLVITEGAAYYSDESVPFDFETPHPFAERAPAAEAALQSFGLLDFPYSLADGWGHEVWVYRELDGLSTNFPEISAGVGENGRLAFASYQPFDQLAALGMYPLITAEAAWQQIQDGIGEDTPFSITPAATQNEVVPESQPSGFKYWPREHQSGQEVHLYTFPTVFLPVDEGLPPLIHALNYTVQTDEETSRALADQLGKNVHFWGILDKNTNTLALAGWEPVLELNPLIKNGTIQWQGEQVVLVDQEGSGFILPDAPADLTDGSAVNVFAWAARETGQAYPVLDWEGIDTQIAGSSGEAIAIPEVLPPPQTVYEQISINEAELAYYVYPELVSGENGRFQQSYWLLPVWQFTGLAENGDTVTFTVQATVQ
jgi:hypothetical protein